VRNKIVAAAIALTLTSFAAVGAFASQDGGMLKMLSGGVLSADTTPTDTVAATDTPAVDLPTSTDTAEATDTPEASDTPSPTATLQSEDTSTPTAEAAATSGDDDGDGRGVEGIPSSNPAHHPDDDGECDHGDTDVKTTPSGTQVNVPCQAADNHDGQQGPGGQSGPDGGDGGDDGHDGGQSHDGSHKGGDEGGD
jgi:hypothetical protein